MTCFDFFADPLERSPVASQMRVANPFLLTALHVSLRAPCELSMCATEPASSRFDRLTRLESALANAVGAEDYTKAAALRDELQSLRVDEDVAVLAANSRFYEAFSTRDLKMMADLWRADGDQVICSHPGFPPVLGHELVMSSWKQIFSGIDDQIRPSDVHVRLLQGGASALVTCIEQIGDSGSSKLIATNIFEKSDNGWRMVLHHAGPLMVSEKDAADAEKRL